MENKSETVCFSGHRILHDPQEAVKQQLENAIRNCVVKSNYINKGVMLWDFKLKTAYL